MDPTIRKVVNIHVRDGNRRALQKLRAQQRRLIADLNILARNYDTSKSIAQCEEDIAVIEAALTKLDQAAA
jgi:hypothetical protein